jgi:hypothetical protein
MAMCDWTEEKRELRDKTVEDQRAILAKWVKDVVWEMGCTCREAEKFLHFWRRAEGLATPTRGPLHCARKDHSFT